MPIYNNPYFAQAASNIASLFAPPSANDRAAQAKADALQADTNRRGMVYDYATDPNFDQSRFDRLGVGAGLYTPNQSYYAVNKDDATKRYGFDTQAATSRANNVLDNQRSAIGTLFQPLNQGQVRPDVPSELMGVLGLPEVAAATGTPKPLSETEVKGGIIQGMDPDLQAAIAFGSTPVENVVTPEGPRIATRMDAIGKQPAEKGPQTVVNMGPNGIDYGDPGKGLVWERSPDGKVKLDERGAPVAIPFQGGEVWQKEQAAKAAAASGDARADTKNNIVIQDIDRALAAINESPLLTTGVGNQITGGIGGTPAHNLNAILDTVKANVGFDQLQAMRDASPTGGALGQVSEFENRLLQSVMGSLETSQSSKQLEFNLKRLRTVVDEIVNHGLDPEKVAKLNLGGGDAPQTAAPSGAAAPTAPAQPAGGIAEGTVIQNDAGDKMIRRGGKWEPM